MPRSTHRRAPGWLGLLGVVATSLGALGCPGNLDPSLLGGSGTGGTSGGGGTTGAGGGNCTGNLDGANIVTTSCAVSTCHDSASASTLGADLDLTVNATIGSRLIGMTSPGLDSSACAGSTEPYLVAGITPATGLLIQKIVTSPTCAASENPPCCGSPMPFARQALTTSQQQCLIQWATTLITAASQ